MFDLISQGAPTRTAIETIQAEYGVSHSQSYADLSAIRNDLPKLYDYGPGIEERISEQIARAERHYVRCVTDKQHGAGLATLRWIGELLGLTATQRIAADRRRMATAISELQARLAESMRQGATEGSQIEALNEARAIYGMQPLTADEFAAYHSGGAN